MKQFYTYIKLVSILIFTTIFNATNAQTISTIAGLTNLSGKNATDVGFSQSPCLAVDASGNVYFTVLGQSLYKLEKATGKIYLVAGTSNSSGGFDGNPNDGGLATQTNLSDINGVTTDPSGNIYISEFNRIHKVDNSGIITTIAGSSNAGFSGDGGLASAALLYNPHNLIRDNSGNYYFYDYGNYRIRKIDNLGIITTIAGNGTMGNSGDGGLATSAQISTVTSLAVDNNGNVYYTDQSSNLIRRIDYSTGIINKIAGDGTWGFAGDGGLAVSAKISSPNGIAVDNLGNIFFSDYGNHRIRKIDNSGIISTIAGSGSYGFSGDGGNALNANFQSALSLAIDNSGSIYFVDNYRIRKIYNSSIITTIAGNGEYFFNADGLAPLQTQLGGPTSVAINTQGEIYFTDPLNYRVRKITNSGTIVTVAGTGENGYGGDGSTATSAKLAFPNSIAFNPQGDLFIADQNNHRIRKVDHNSGIITTVAGNGSYGFSGDGGAATSAMLGYPSGIALDVSGNIYIADLTMNRIRKVDHGSGIITTIAGNGIPGFSGDGGTAISAQIDYPNCVGVDMSGNIYIGDQNNSRIRKINNSGIITTIAGTGNYNYSGDGGPATVADINTATSIAADNLGNIYFMNYGIMGVRKIDSHGIISTIAGNQYQGFSGDGGAATSAKIYGLGIALDNSGNLYIADTYNFKIRKVTGLIPVISTNANLTSYTIDQGTLTPAFDKNTTSYTAGVSNATSVIHVSPTVEESHATVQVRINGGAYSAVTSGSASGDLSLHVGANPIDVKVTAQDGTTTKTYTTTVTRDAPGISLGAYTLSNSASLLAHYDATDNSSLIQSGSIVTGWKDLSGNGYDLTQSSTGPTLSTINGLQALDFNGAKRFTNASVPLSKNVTVLMAIKHNSAITIWGNYMCHGDHDNDWSIRHNADGNNSVGFHTNNDNGTVLSSLVNGDSYILVGRLTQNGNNTNKVEYWAYDSNGTSATKTATYPTTISTGNKAVFVGTSDLSNENSNSKIGEILYFNTNLSDSDLYKAEHYLIDKWFSGIVPGGSGGGLESKDLGNAVVNRVYNRAITNANTATDYSKLQVYTGNNKATATTFGAGSNNTTLQLSAIMPDISKNGYVAYISTPTDITSITNAKQVMSIDFTINKQAKAVAFATETEAALYDHTKPICDRLKGSSLQSVSNTTIGGYNFVLYTLKDAEGMTEYATSFSIGAKNGRNSFSVQSTWLQADYTAEDIMYNYQFWAATPGTISSMVTDVLNKFVAIQPVSAIGASKIPGTYIVSGSREGTNLNMTIRNLSANTSGYFKIADLSNEQSTSAVSRQVSFTANANGETSVSIPMSDIYASNISMYVNNNLADVVYMADGNWAINYNSNTTNITSFNVNNNANRIYDANEYSLMRDVNVKGTSSDYVTIVKLLKGGAVPVDLSSYNTLRVTAGGGYNLRVILVKNSITNWSDQYQTVVPLSNDPKDYFIPLDRFTSTSNSGKIKANDVAFVAFAIEVGSNANSVLNSTLSNISFMKQDANYLTTVIANKELNVYPNPVVNKNVTCNFYNAGSAQQMTLKITDMMGRVVTTKQVSAISGINTVNVTLTNTMKGVHVITVENANGDRYKAKSIMIEK